MLKKFNNFAFESNHNIMRVLEISDVLHRQNYNFDMACIEINKILSGKEIKILKTSFDEKKHMFVKKYLLNKYKDFNYAGKLTMENESEYYIRFDHDCYIKLERSLSIEYKNIFSEN